MFDQKKLFQEIEKKESIPYHYFQNEQNFYFQKWKTYITNFEAGRFASIYTFDLVDGMHHEKSIVGFDGSQIYPDKHRGHCWYLLHTAAVIFQYRKQSSTCLFDSYPRVYAAQYELEKQEVNESRSLQEFEHMLFIFERLRGADQQILFFYDGSFVKMLFQDQNIKPRFSSMYTAFFTQKIPCIAYVSATASYELIRRCSGTMNMLISDTDLMDFWLHENQYSHFFYYSPEICFFYLKTIHEIVKIEFPAYLLHEQYGFHMIAELIFDQINKGNGYPICLAEAHRAAQISEQNQEIFYRLIEKKLGKNQQKNSQKFSKKRFAYA